MKNRLPAASAAILSIPRAAVRSTETTAPTAFPVDADELSEYDDMTLDEVDFVIL